MKITGAATTLFACPPAPSRRGAAAPATSSGCVLELLTDSGLRGIAIGEADLRRELAALTAKHLKGEDPRAAPALWQRMLDSSAGTRRGDRAGAAMALLDVALWDLKAKANREPLWKTLGGARPRPIAFASCIDGTLNEKETFARLARLAREFGCRSAVLRMASSAAADLRRLARARKILSREGVDPELALAAAESWSSARTIRRVGDIEKRIDLAWIAPAATGGGSRALKSISEGVRAAVCAGRGLRFPADFRPHFRERSIDIVQVDLRATGITGALQLADAAFGFELPVMLCDAPGNIQAQLAGAMPYVMNVEITEPLPPVDLFRSDVRIEHGRAVSGDAPGNGLVIDRAALARAAVDSLPARRGRK